MSIAKVASAHPFIQPLESRRLLSLTLLGPEVTVPMPTEMSRFDMAVADNGSFIIVGDPIEQPDSPPVIAIRYSAAGEQIGAPLTLDNHGFTVSVAMDTDGDAVVAYLKSSGGLYLVRISKDGVVHAPQLVATGHLSETAVSMDEAGGFFVGWVAADNVYVRAFDANGTPRAPALEVVTGGGIDGNDSVAVAARRDGSGAVVAYDHFVEGDVGIQAQLVSPTGKTGDVATGTGGLPGSPAGADLAIRPDGSFVMGFEAYGSRISETDPITTSGFLKRFDASGSQIGPTIALGESLPGSGVDQRITSVTIDTMPDGGFIAALQQGSEAGVTTYVRRYAAAGVSIDGPLAVDTDPPRGHVIGANADGRAVLAYLQGSFTEFPDAPESGTIHFRRLFASSSELRGADLFVNGT